MKTIPHCRAAASHTDHVRIASSAGAALAPRSGLSVARAPAWMLALGLAFTLVGMPRPAQAQGAATTATAIDLPAGKRREPVTLNFVNAEIEGVARAMGAILDRQIIVDPRVRGQITLYSEQPLAPRDAYLSFLAALRGLGFTVVEVSGLLKVVPEAEGKLQTGTVAVGEVNRRGDQILTQVFRLQHENANNLVAVLRPLISPNNTINANPGNNTLVITDYADNLQRLSKIIVAMDLPGTTDVEVVALRHAVASDLAPVVLKLSESAPGAPGAPAAASGLSVLAEARTNSLLLRAASPAKLAQARALIEKLDRPGSGGAGGSGIYVVYLKNADATRLAQVLRASFATDPRGGSTTPGSAPGAAPSQAPSAVGGMGGASAQSTAPIGAAAAPSTGGFVQADPATNSLIITATEPLYRQLRAVIEQLDARRAQVYIETMLVEVNATKAADAGFQWQTLIGKDGDKYGVIGGTNFGTGGNNILNLSVAAAGGSSGSTSLSNTLPSSGLNVGIVRKYGSVYGLSALARFLETNADGNILSTPNLVTLDNEEAKIVVGQNVPFVTGSFTNTGTGGGGATNPFQTIERKDVGITLRVKPQIGENGTVRLLIYQEASSVVNQNVSQGVADATAGLVTNKRSIESNVVVDDGDILVLGGLMQENFQNNQDKVPGLGSIPGLGALFRNENRTRNKSNLMVFLRPVVMRGAEQSRALSLDRYEQIRAQQQETQPPARPLLPDVDVPVLPARGAGGKAPAPSPASPDTAPGKP